jgi:hypothetical protein
MKNSRKKMAQLKQTNKGIQLELKIKERIVMTPEELASLQMTSLMCISNPFKGDVKIVKEMVESN